MSRETTHICPNLRVEEVVIAQIFEKKSFNYYLLALSNW